jgi:ATP-binding cassette, subfamily B, bacterial
MNDLLRRLSLLTGLVWRADPKRAAAVAALTLAQTLSASLAPLWLKLLIDGVLRSDFRSAVVGAFLTAAGIGFHGAGVLLAFLLRANLTERASLLLQEEICGVTAGLPGLEHFERPEYLDKVHLLQSDTPKLLNSGWAVVDAFSLGIRILITGVLLGSVHPAMLLLPVFTVPSLITGRQSQRVLEVVKDETAEGVRLEQHLFGLATSAVPAKELRVFGLEAEIDTRARVVWEEITSKHLRANTRAWMLGSVGWLFFAIGYTAAAALLLLQATRGQATPGDVVLVVTAGGQVAGHAGGAIGLVKQALDTAGSLGRYLWILDYARSTLLASPSAVVPDRLASGVDFEHVTFRYPGTQTDVLKDITVHFPAGSTVAIVGENGAGKTTAVKLLCGFYCPTEGRIVVDGVDLTSVDPLAWRQHLSAGFQDFARFEFVAREAVGVGDLALIEDCRAVEAAMERAHAADLIATLENGLETQLGRQFATGVELSGGQWQKLALSRAMMRESPLLLILDEPTAALDASAEHHLFQRYVATAKRVAAANGAITVLVSHRFSTVRMADLIVVFNGGLVAEVGSHSELMLRRGLYAELFNLQAFGYR